VNVKCLKRLDNGYQMRNHTKGSTPIY